MISINSLTTAVARIFGTPAQQSADRVQNAVNRAYHNAADRYASNDVALFTKEFVLNEGAPIIQAFLAGKQSRHDAAAELSRRWNVDLGPISSRELRWRVADTTMMADIFLMELAHALD